MTTLKFPSQSEAVCPPVPAAHGRGPPGEAGAGQWSEEEECGGEDEYQGLLSLQPPGPPAGPEVCLGGEDLPSGYQVLGGHHHGGEPRDQHQAEQEV